MKDKEIYDKETAILVGKLHAERERQQEGGGTANNNKSTKMRMEFKRGHMKSFSSQKTLDIYTYVAGRHVSEGSLVGNSH